MTIYCPEWIFGCCASYSARGFLSTESSLNSISRKFANGLSEHYKEVKFEELTETAEGILQFLSEIDAGEEAVTYIDNYIYKRIHFLNSGAERKLSGMFSSALDPVKTREYGYENSVKVFRVTTFAIRNNTMPKAPAGWNISDVDNELGWLKELIEKPADILDGF